ncbi:uncharacterized protein LOC110265009 [Arachis ipaensis]|uniref:uncharacterized protein LOC110265009 n=1 Tax=Arachis ipaensis TaxID=130454 RepID=UPI000A2B63B9|nr:uncharacterized protein LOC110265009 [Arachis ipaensis]XP_025664559.1 uncharacterized protein LOC112762987 [Arachis hypogaea]
MRFFEQFRMRKSVFNHLCNDLVLNYGLKSTRDVSGEEMVTTFLYMLGQGASYRMLEERFQHSSETIFRQFHHVLSCVKKLVKNIIRPIDPSFGDTPKYIMDNDRYWPYFKDCIGAIDGSAHDTRIFMEALRIKKLNFPHPPEGKYYLVDAGYPTFKGFLGLYRHTSLHNFIRMMDSDDISILQKFEDIVSLQANEDDGTTVKNGSTNSEINEWEEPTQEDVRVMEEIRDNIRDQLSDQIN